MSAIKNVLWVLPRASGLATAGGLVLAGVGLASCSSNVSRFDYPMFASADKPADNALTTATIAPIPEEPVYQPPSNQTVVSRDLPPPPSQQAPYPTQPPAHRVARTTPTPASEPSAMPLPQRAPAPPAPPQFTVAVKKGDSLSLIARRHRVSVQQIMTANKLRNTRLSIGQKLVIPGKRPPATEVAMRAKSYQVRSGDSLSAIAKRYGMEYQDLASHNNLPRNAVLQPGQILKIPGTEDTAPSRVRIASRSSDMPVSQPQQPRSSKPPAVREVRLTPKRKAVLPAPKPMTDNQFRWPVRGRVISGFGPKPDGKHNDGINVAVPLGASVKAAENGVVAYAGAELEGYGNLILIRHANNWVSAYAHNDEVLVKRGDEVRRGQIIAKAGKTGTVSRPQVHFELRRGSQPVDPLKYLAKS